MYKKLCSITTVCNIYVKEHRNTKIHGRFLTSCLVNYKQKKERCQELVMSAFSPLHNKVIPKLINMIRMTNEDKLKKFFFECETKICYF